MCAFFDRNALSYCLLYCVQCFGKCESGSAPYPTTYCYGNVIVLACMGFSVVDADTSRASGWLVQLN